MRQLLAAARFSLPENSRNIPGLVLCSEGDAMVAPACSERIAQFYHWPLLKESTAGHDLPLDSPHWVVEKIKEWVNQSIMLKA